MHLLINSDRINLKAFGILPPGSWVLSDRNAFEIAALSKPGTVKLCAYASIWARSDQPARLLIQRSGAWGDLMFLTPVLRALKQYNAKRHISLSCHAKHHPLFEGNPNIDELQAYPLKGDGVISTYDHIVTLEEVVEQWTEHASVAMGRHFNLELQDTECRYEYFVKDHELLAAQAAFPRTRRPRVSVQLSANALHRSYPAHLWNSLIGALQSKGSELFIFGSKPQLSPFRESAVLKKIDHPFREAAAIMKTCDAHVGVDSAWLHMAAALDIPAVGLFGPTDWHKTVMPGSNTIALTGRGDCVRCNFSPYGGRHFPINHPCANARVCSVLADIPIDRIVVKVEQQLNAP